MWVPLTIAIWLGALAILTFLYCARSINNGRNRKAAEASESSAPDATGSAAGNDARWYVRPDGRSLTLYPGTTAAARGNLGLGGKSQTPASFTVTNTSGQPVAISTNQANQLHIAAQHLLALHQAMQATTATMTGNMAAQAFNDVGSFTQTPDLPIENKFGEITGWRCWYVRSGLLHSVSASNVWLPGEIEGLKPGQKVTDYGSEGIHAYKSKKDAVMYLGSGSTATTFAVGQIKMWGDVIEHEMGYRAEFASIVSIDYVIAAPQDEAKFLSIRDYLRETYLPTSTDTPPTPPRCSP